MRRGPTLAIVALLAACGGGAHTVEREPVRTTARVAPDIAGATLTGERASLRAFRGKPVLVNVWSSW